MFERCQYLQKRHTEGRVMGAIHSKLFYLKSVRGKQVGPAEKSGQNIAIDSWIPSNH